MSDSSGSLIDLVVTSGLCSSEQLAETKLDAGGPGESLDVAKELVRRGYLTRWQVEQLLAGRVNFFIDGFKLTDRVGRGGMGTVYRALEVETGRSVALKIMPDMALNNAVLVSRFRREFDLIASLSHPNIVAAYDFGSFHGKHYFVMEYVDGHSLNRWSREFGHLPVSWACEFIRQAADGLEYARERGIVHRDIKPSNLLVVYGTEAAPPQIKISDFGLARVMDVTASEDTELTVAGEILGTVDYIAPEQIHDSKSADTRADIFSLGCTLYKLLTGTVPYHGGNVMEKLANRVIHDPADVRELRSDVSPSLAEVITKMIQPDPADRYQAPAEVAEKLRAFGMVGHTDDWDEFSDAASTIVGEPEDNVEELYAAEDLSIREQFSQMGLHDERNRVRRSRRHRWLRRMVLMTILLAAAVAFVGWRDEIRQSVEGSKWVHDLIDAVEPFLSGTSGSNTSP